MRMHDNNILPNINKTITAYHQLLQRDGNNRIISSKKIFQTVGRLQPTEELAKAPLHLRGRVSDGIGLVRWYLQRSRPQLSQMSLLVELGSVILSLILRLEGGGPLGLEPEDLEVDADADTQFEISLDPGYPTFLLRILLPYQTSHLCPWRKCKRRHLFQLRTQHLKRRNSRFMICFWNWNLKLCLPNPPRSSSPPLSRRLSSRQRNPKSKSLSKTQSYCKNIHPFRNLLRRFRSVLLPSTAAETVIETRPPKFFLVGVWRVPIFAIVLWTENLYAPAGKHTAMVHTFPALQISGACIFTLILVSAWIFRSGAKRHSIWFSILIVFSYCPLLVNNGSALGRHCASRKRDTDIRGAVFVGIAIFN